MFLARTHTPSIPIPQGHSRRALAAGLLIAAASLTPACSSLRDVDKKIDLLVQHRSDSLNAGARPPRVDSEEQGRWQAPGQADLHPETVNPSAYELPYPMAAEDRDVAVKLDEYAEIPADAMHVNLTTSFRIAQETSREYRNAEEDYLLAAIRLLIERHRWSPRFFDDLSANIAGDFEGGAETALNLVNDLRVTQRLPYGGDVEARLIWRATEQLRTSVTDDYTQSSSLVLSANIPLLRDAGLIAREDLIQAERDLVYAARDFERFRREFLVDIAQDYFGLVAQLSSIENQRRSLDSRRNEFDRMQARFEAGKVSASRARRLESDVLAARSALIDRREAYLVALDRFKIRLGMPVETPVIIDPTSLELPEPEIAPAQSALLALRYRLDLQNSRDRINDARRDVANSYNQLLPDLDFDGSVNFDTDPTDRVGGLLSFDLDDARYALGLTLSLPLDREIEHLNVRSAIIGLQRQIRNYDQFRDNVILDARAQRREIDQRRLTLILAEERVESTRLELEELIIKEEEANLISDSQDDLIQAEDARDSAMRDLRNAILDYLLATGQLRVRHDGSLQPLPGMGSYEEMRDPEGPETEAIEESIEAAQEAVEEMVEDSPADDGS